MINVLPCTLFPKDYQKILREDTVLKTQRIEIPFGIFRKNVSSRSASPARKPIERRLIYLLHSSFEEEMKPAIGSTATDESTNAKWGMTLFRI